MPGDFPELTHPVIQAPMAGGPSTPELAAAVTNAGGLGFLAAGYRSTEQLRADIEATRTLTDGPVGVNLFLVARSEVADQAIAAYAAEIAPDAARYGTELGEPRFDDDALEAKLGLVRELQVPIVSFTFGCPSPAVVMSRQAEGTGPGAPPPWVPISPGASARGECPAARGLGGDRRRGRRRRRAGRGSGRRADRYRVHALPRGRHQRAPPGGALTARGNRNHSSVQR